MGCLKFCFSLEIRSSVWPFTISFQDDRTESSTNSRLAHCNAYWSTASHRRFHVFCIVLPVRTVFFLAYTNGRFFRFSLCQLFIFIWEKFFLSVSGVHTSQLARNAQCCTDHNDFQCCHSPTLLNGLQILS